MIRLPINVDHMKVSQFLEVAIQAKPTITVGHFLESLEEYIQDAYPDRYKLKNPSDIFKVTSADEEIINFLIKDMNEAFEKYAHNNNPSEVLRITIFLGEGVSSIPPMAWRLFTTIIGGCGWSIASYEYEKNKKLNGRNLVIQVQPHSSRIQQIIEENYL